MELEIYPVVNIDWVFGKKTPSRFSKTPSRGCFDHPVSANMNMLLAALGVRDGVGSSVLLRASQLLQHPSYCFASRSSLRELPLARRRSTSSFLRSTASWPSAAPPAVLSSRRSSRRRSGGRTSGGPQPGARTLRLSVRVGRPQYLLSPRRTPSERVSCARSLLCSLHAVLLGLTSLSPCRTAPTNRLRYTTPRPRKSRLGAGASFRR